MASIASIIEKGTGRAGAWRVVFYYHNNVPTHDLWHYGTMMLSWTEVNGRNVAGRMSTGYGSVSDQQGMNKAFRILNLPYYYRRAGGAKIHDLFTDESLTRSN